MFLLILSVIILGIHMLSWFLLSKLLQRYSVLPRIGLVINIAALIGIGMSFGPDRNNWPWLVQAIAMWIMFQILLIVLMAIALVVRYVLYDRIKNTPVDASRRRFVKAVGIGLPCVAAGASLYGGLGERKNTVVRNFDLPVEGLGDRAAGCRIAQLSDIHLGPFFDLQDLKELLQQAADTQADLLVLTGDVFDDNNTTLQAAKLIDSFRDRFPRGIFYCRGNHEHFRSIPLVEAALSRTEIHNLVNSNELLIEDSRPVYIAGTDYPMERDQFDFLQNAYTKGAMKGIPDNAVKILLAHHPDFVTSAADYNVELVLSGHTHGGQIGIFGISLAPPLFKYMRGWYHEGKTALYVHSGNGSWFPFRLGCPPEIAVFTLTKA